MRLHRFYLSEEMTGQKLGSVEEFSVNSKELINQIRNVFRLKHGDHVIFFDGSGSDFECELVPVLTDNGQRKGDNVEKAIKFRVLSCERSRYMPKLDVYACVAITKKDTFEWIVEKATELGVSHILPVLAERSEKKSLNMERLNKIALEASEQSGRGDVPEILSIVRLDEVFGYFSGAKKENDNLAKLAEHGGFGSARLGKGVDLVAFHTEGDLWSGDAFNQTKGNPMAVFIGPEGGWSPKEIDLFNEHRIKIICLGKQVLRAETAVVVTLAKVLL
jgi:16S rRNA (uracil1498-N3)-methyltransferase